MRLGFRMAAVFCLLWPLTVFAYLFDSHEQGWFWYQEFYTEKLHPPRPTPLGNPTEVMMGLQKSVEESLNRAILSPTSDNLKNYAEHYFNVIHRGQRFTDAYKVMLLNHPQYDYSLKFGTNHLIQAIEEQKQKKQQLNKIQRFAKHHGFLFFFAEQCPHCHAFAPVVKQFATQYGIDVLAVSLDGGTLPQFPHVVQDNGTAKALNVYSLPSLFAINPKNKQVVPIANGALSLSELEQNIMRILEVQ